MNTLKKQLVALAGALILSTAATTTFAAWAIDTGTPTGSTEYTLDGTDFWAGQVTLQSGQIHAIEAYVNDFGGGGSFTIALYGDKPTTHLPGTFMNSWVATFNTTSGQYGWNGVSGLTYDVVGGTYWIALEVPDAGFNGLVLNGAPNPLAKYAFNDGGFLGYQAINDSFGLRVDAVPEPETYAMLLAGLGLLGFAARRRKQ
jgi:hypothetical protein